MSDDNLTPEEWEAAPEEFDCPRCKGAMERTRYRYDTPPYAMWTQRLALTSHRAGSVRCTKCDYRESVMGYLGKSMTQVQPMPIYLSEPEGGGPSRE